MSKSKNMFRTDLGRKFSFTLKLHVNQQLQILMNNNPQDLKHHPNRQHLQSSQYDHDFVLTLTVKMLLESTLKTNK